MTHEQLGQFIHEFGRTLDENLREEFLETMKSFAKEKTEIITTEEKAETETVIKMIGDLEEISAGRKVLYSEIKEDYDDWYNSGDDEILSSDPQHLVDSVVKAVLPVDECTAYIAAYGEILESSGVSHGKDTVMESHQEIVF